jgi:hypothetical protein
MIVKKDCFCKDYVWLKAENIWNQVPPRQKVLMPNSSKQITGFIVRGLEIKPYDDAIIG